VTQLGLPGVDAVGITADNPGPFTLTGTNTWVIGRNPAWVVDPGPDLSEHAEAIRSEVLGRGGLGGIALTHDHADHSAGVPQLRAWFPDAPLAAGRGEVDLQLEPGTHFGPLEAVPTPGHAPDHFAFVTGAVGLTGDAVLGYGSVFISPDPGALAGYLQGLARLRRRELTLLAPGHGPVVTDPAVKLDEYAQHRIDRERRLIESLDHGARSVQEMLDSAWSDVPDHLRAAAAVTLAAHLDKLADEGRLPEGVERPTLPERLTQP
jgi:glyoxylase-like metal-dependent hydrolase (beta-lactamase superfamily II)